MARFFDLYGWTVDRVVSQYPDIEEMRKYIFSISITDEQTRETIKSVHKRYNVVLGQHGAVGWAGRIFKNSAGAKTEKP